MNTSIYVSNLCYNLDAQAISAIFQGRGLSVNKVVLFTDLYGFSKGKCRVKFNNSQDANKAISLLDGCFVSGRMIHVRPYIWNQNRYDKRQHECDDLITRDTEQADKRQRTNEPQAPNRTPTFEEIFADILKMLPKKDNTDDGSIKKKIETIKSNQVFSDSDTFKLINQKLGSNNSDIQAIDNVYKLSLICPLTRKRINEPARGQNCTHLECYDLESYVKMGFETFKWNCSICRKYVPLNELKVDSYISNILQKCTDNEVTIGADYKWTTTTKKNKLMNKTIIVNDLSDTEADDSIIILDDDQPIQPIKHTQKDPSIIKIEKVQEKKECLLELPKEIPFLKELTERRTTRSTKTVNYRETRIYKKRKGNQNEV